MTELIQIYAHFFDNWMSNSIKGEIFINFRFNYDLIDFVDKPQSNFYDIFTKNCKLEAKGSVRNLMKSIRTLIVKEKLLK